MSTVFQFKKPSRPPPPPPVEGDYIKISECLTGKPLNDKQTLTFSKPAGYKSQASTSFSGTLKPTPSNDYLLQSTHQKSRSQPISDHPSTYLYLDLPSSSTLNSRHVSTVYKTVDFMKTDALNKCKVERNCLFNPNRSLPESESGD